MPPKKKVKVSGEVSMIYPSKDACYIRLKDPQYVPRDDFFMLPLSHPNYNALYSLAVVAAVNRYTLSIRTVTEITDTEYPKISYMTVSW